MKPTAIIPIKLNNQRLPGKNTMILGGKPVVQYQQEELLKIRDSLERIVIYCSDESIKRYILPGVDFVRRPEWLDGF